MIFRFPFPINSQSCLGIVAHVKESLKSSFVDVIFVDFPS